MDPTPAPRIAWLDDAPTVKPAAVDRVAALVAGAWVFTRILILYFILPLFYVFALFLLGIVLIPNGMLRGVTVAMALGVGLGWWFDELLR